ATGFQVAGDLSEEFRARCRFHNELRNQNTERGVVGVTGRQGGKIAFVETAALSVAFVFRPLAADIQHGAGWLHGGELPSWMAPREVGYLFAGACAYAQNAGFLRKPGEIGIQKRSEERRVGKEWRSGGRAT